MRRRHKVWYAVEAWTPDEPQGIWRSLRTKKWTIGMAPPCQSMRYPVFRFATAVRTARRIIALMEREGVRGEVVLSRFYIKRGRRRGTDFVLRPRLAPKEGEHA